MGGNLIQAQHEGVSVFSSPTTLYSKYVLATILYFNSLSSLEGRIGAEASIRNKQPSRATKRLLHSAYHLMYFTHYCTTLLWHSCGFLGRLWTTEKVGGGLLSRRAGSLLAIHFYNLSLGLAGMEVLEGAKKLDGLGE